MHLHLAALFALARSHMPTAKLAYLLTWAVTLVVTVARWGF